MKPIVRTRGGQATEAFVRRALAAQGVRRIEVGFFASDRNRRQVPLSHVAAWNEYGTSRIPARPFMLRATRALTASRVLTDVVKAHIDPATMTVDTALAAKLGETARDAIRTSIRTTSDPPNAETTRKRGGSPLIDRGDLLRGVRVRVFRA